MQLPPGFIRNVRGAFGGTGGAWLERLPHLVAQAAQRWGLSGVEPLSRLSYNFVACAVRGSERVILKIGVPQRELTSEMAALRRFDGRGACRLIECDEANGFLLLERLVPGRRLSSLEDDEAATRIAVQVMRDLWRPAPPDDRLIRLRDWFDGLGRIRPHYGGGTGPFPKEALERVESILPELLADANLILLHGDFHHDNILSSERGWLAVDPKGVVGPAGYEIGPFMINPRDRPLEPRSFEARTARRIDILEQMLGWERGIILRWAAAHALLSAWWDFEDGLDGDSALQCALRLLDLK